ncbi:SPFH domain-containing protein [Laspinema olomoucense]|uniref:SPFH domain-containing protein n=1 Tax=Laspinema olomoucense TaxID=3231600 RepID=UPI0021BB0B18|nr:MULTISPECIES: SPFH domain-containing protein [unclassified Laspinema]MCT7992009.1 SPFH/Band 7/PHB domain protein [Laspinema sp. D3a]MCT7994424.1 SPFH/Band 7/PHB domain protein [Laspinema sp. D3c]
MYESLFLIFLAVTGTSLAGSVKIIKQGDEALVETLGKYDGKKLQPGLNFMIPFLEQVAYQETTREQFLDIPPQTCMTRDNVSISVDAVVYWRILNLEKAYYKVKNLQSAMVTLVTTLIRSEMSKLKLEQTFMARSDVNELLLQQLDIATEPWGIKVTRVELRDIIPSLSVREAMELQMSSERKKQAAILTSEGQREAAINNAKGEAEARILQAKARQQAALLQAEAQQQQQVLNAKGTAEAVSTLAKTLESDPYATEAMQFLLAQTYLDISLKMAGEGKGSIPDPRQIPATLDGVRSLVSQQNNGKVKQLS